MGTQMMEIRNIDDLDRMATLMSKSDSFKALKREEIAVRIMAGAEWGLGPFTSIRSIYLVNGQPQLSTGLMAALLVNAGFRYSIDAQTNEICTITLHEGEIIAGTVSYTIQDAKDAGLAGKDIWRKYTSDMLFNRCMSRVVRRLAPHISLGGVYSHAHGETEIPEKVQPEHIERDITPEPAQVNEAGLSTLITRLHAMPREARERIKAQFRIDFGLEQDDPTPIGNHHVMTGDDIEWIEAWLKADLDEEFKQAVDK